MRYFYMKNRAYFDGTNYYNAGQVFPLPDGQKPQHDAVQVDPATGVVIPREPEGMGAPSTNHEAQTSKKRKGGAGKTKPAPETQTETETTETDTEDGGDSGDETEQ